MRNVKGGGMPYHFSYHSKLLLIPGVTQPSYSPQLTNPLVTKPICTVPQLFAMILFSRKWDRLLCLGLD